MTGEAGQPTIYELIGHVLTEMPAVPKNGTAPQSQGGYRFRGIEDTVEALKPLFAKHGVFLLPEVVEWRPSERVIGSGKTMYCMTLRVRFTFYGPAGDSVSAVTIGEGTDMGDKATQKAMTAAFKYCLFETFLVGDSAADSEAHDVPESVARQAARVVPDGMLSAAEAKRRLLELCQGDRGRASELWGVRGSDPILVQDFDELAELAAADDGRPM